MLEPTGIIPHAHKPMQQDRGLYGLLIVEEKERVSVDREVALVIDDWRIEDSGEIETASLSSLHDAAHAGRYGNIMTVNGKPFERLPVKSGERLRVRICSPCNSRILKFAVRRRQSADHRHRRAARRSGRASRCGGDARPLPARRPRRRLHRCAGQQGCDNGSLARASRHRGIRNSMTAPFNATGFWTAPSSCLQRMLRGPMLAGSRMRCASNW